MSNFKNKNCNNIIMDGVKHPVITNANAVLIYRTFELFITRWHTRQLKLYYSVFQMFSFLPF